MALNTPSDQIVILFDEDGSGSVFAGIVKGTLYDPKRKEVIVRMQQIETHSTLNIAMQNHQAAFANALLATAAELSIQLNYYKKKVYEVQQREESYKANIAVLERHNEILERQLINVTP